MHSTGFTVDVVAILIVVVLNIWFIVNSLKKGHHHKVIDIIAVIAISLLILGLFTGICPASSTSRQAPFIVLKTPDGGVFVGEDGKPVQIHSIRFYNSITNGVNTLRIDQDFNIYGVEIDESYSTVN